eukprot:TRINITY_DN1794_c0_g1_i23.p1 TRINITY_DN1794_c0_g1~~TRINITY_DN1794_c0_g1_i23.p1  ORF type:complete len:765 (+),score=203.20 TRINITY_DN1794_c0_g1_i23:624-2918(+)
MSKHYWEAQQVRLYVVDNDLRDLLTQYFSVRKAFTSNRKKQTSDDGRSLLSTLVSRCSPRKVSQTLVPLMIEKYLVPHLSEPKKLNVLPERLIKMWCDALDIFTTHWPHFTNTLLLGIATNIVESKQTFFGKESHSKRAYNNSLLLCWYKYLIQKYGSKDNFTETTTTTPATTTTTTTTTAAAATTATTTATIITSFTSSTTATAATTTATTTNTGTTTTSTTATRGRSAPNTTPTTPPTATSRITVGTSTGIPIVQVSCNSVPKSTRSSTPSDSSSWSTPSVLDTSEVLHTHHQEEEEGFSLDTCGRNSLASSMPPPTSLVLTGMTPVLMAEAEVLLVAVELMDSCKNNYFHNFFIQLNHSQLNAAIFDVFGIFDPKLRHNINEIISQPPREWSTVSNRLRRELQIPSDVVENLKKAFQLNGNPHQVIVSLYTLFERNVFRSQEDYYNATSTLRYLSRLLSVLDAMSFPTGQIFLDCGLVSTDKFASGIWFHVLAITKPNDKVSCICVGGRYDLLIDHFEEKFREQEADVSSERPFKGNHDDDANDNDYFDGGDLAEFIQQKTPKKGKEIQTTVKLCAVGLTLTLDKVIDFAIKDNLMNMEKSLDIHTLFKKHTRMTVHVCSPPALFNERLQIVSMLWEARIRTDFSKNNHDSVDEQLALASKNCVRFGVVVLSKHHSSLQVVHMDASRLSEMVPQSNLVQYLLQHSNSYSTTTPKPEVPKKETTQGKSLSPTPKQTTPSMPIKNQDQIRNTLFHRLGIPTKQ